MFGARCGVKLSCLLQNNATILLLMIFCLRLHHLLIDETNNAALARTNSKYYICCHCRLLDFESANGDMMSKPNLTFFYFCCHNIIYMAANGECSSSFVESIN